MDGGISTERNKRFFIFGDDVVLSIHSNAIIPDNYSTIRQSLQRNYFLFLVF